MSDSAKPNSISEKSDYGTLQSGTGGWDTAAPTSGGSPQVDPFSAQMLGGSPVGSSDHNSEWLNATPVD